MSGMDREKELWDKLRYFWNSLPEIIKLTGAILGIILAFNTLSSPIPAEIDFFAASPEIIEEGGNSTLSWGVSGATNISIEPGIGVVESNGTLSVSPAKTTTYKLTASNGEEEKVAFCTLTVEIEPLVIDSFAADPDVIGAGESSVLNWQVSGATSVTIDPDVGNVDPVGTFPVSPVESTTYELKASNGDEEETAYCIVTVEAKTPSINSFNADPDVIGAGQSTNLIWNVSDAARVAIEPGIGTVGLSGSQRVFPNETTTYTLTAINEAGSVDASKVVFVEGLPAPNSTLPLSTPKQLSPADGTVFAHSPRVTTLQWEAVSGAASFTVEIDSYSPDTGTWLSESGSPWIVPGINATSYTFEFPGTEPGRWRIWAVDAAGQESSKSGWWNFNYTV